MATINAIGSQDPIQVAFGGTGLATLTQYSLQVGAGTSTVTQLGVASNGQLPIGSTGANPVLATLSAGTGVGITNGAGSITINATGGGMTWSTVTSSSQAAAVNNGYVVNNGTLCTITLPATAAVGSFIIIAGINAGLWQLAQNASQYIHFGSAVTTTGTGGYLASTLTNDTVTVVCTVTNNGWQVVSSMGNITYN